MTIAARLLCHEVKKGIGTEIVRLHPVYSQDPQNPNHVWSKATPSGQVELTITNDKAFGAFVPGVEYHLTFTPIEKT